MALHYHGLPLTPLSNLELLGGKNVCISKATQRQTNVEWALKNAQSIMWDNGAFTTFQQGKVFDHNDFYVWLEDKIGHPHWAVIPDVIGGSEEQQKELLSTWVYPKEYGAPVWHLGLSFDYLLYLVDNYPKVCLGSSEKYWKVGSREWQNRMDDTFNFLHSKRRYLPWLHGLRMLAQLQERWPLSSADSVNVSRNYKTAGKCPGCMSHRIDTINPPLRWLPTQLF